MYGDVKVDSVMNPQYLEVVIKASKTDVFQKGNTVYLGHTNMSICPVAANLSYMTMKISTPGPFFKYQSRRYLTRARFVEEVRTVLGECRNGVKQVCGPQFLDRCGNNCSSTGTSS